MDNLVYMDISYNDQFYRDYPPNLRKFLKPVSKKLEYLDISHNNIAGLREDSFRDCRNLRTLIVSQNIFTTLPGRLFQTNLRLETFISRIDAFETGYVKTLSPDTFSGLNLKHWIIESRRFHLRLRTTPIQRLVQTTALFRDSPIECAAVAAMRPTG